VVILAEFHITSECTKCSKNRL